MIVMPECQKNHNYIDSDIIDWLDLHFEPGGAYDWFSFIGYRRRNASGLYNCSRRKISELADFIPEMHISQNLDYYITANAFRSPERRTTEAVVELRNIVVDIDCHTDGLDTRALTEAFIWRCKRDLWASGDCPSPNSIVRSGRGVQLWWALEAASAQQPFYYKKLQAWIMDQLQGVLDENPEALNGLTIDRGASTKLAGWFRLPLTYNTASERWGTLEILHEERWDILDVLEVYVPSEYKYAQRPQGKAKEYTKQSYIPLAPRDSEVLKDGTTAMAMRVYQLMRLRALRAADVGQRNLFNFIVYCSLRADFNHEEALQRTKAFNEGFITPMTEDELDGCLVSAVEKAYKLPNSWIIEKLEITRDEQRAIGLYPVAVYSSQRKANATRDDLRAIVKEDRDRKILTMFADGANKSVIARELGISRKTVIRVLGAAENAVEAPQGRSDEMLMAAGAEADVKNTSAIVKVSQNGAIYVFSPIPRGSAVSPTQTITSSSDTLLGAGTIPGGG